MSFLNSWLITVPVTRSKLLKSSFNILLTEARLGSYPSRPERDLQYHRSNSLIITLLGAGPPFRKYLETETPIVDMKLCRPISIGGAIDRGSVSTKRARQESATYITN
jgi:hypothetical protein